MTERYDVLVRVVSQKGNCFQNHKVGDEWIVSRKTPEGICLSAFSSIYPHIRILQLGGAFPWEKDDPHVTREACPDPQNPVVFELRRLPNKQ